MMAWSPIILLAALMIGYPLAQLVALRFRRPYRIRFRHLIETLHQRHPSPGEQKAIARLMSDSRGHWPDPIAHLMLPVVITTEVLRGNKLHDVARLEEMLNFMRAFLQAQYQIPLDALIWADPEFTRAIRMSTKLRITNSPISFVVGLALSLPAILIARIVNRDSNRPQSLRQEILERFAGADRAIFN